MDLGVAVVRAQYATDRGNVVHILSLLTGIHLVFLLNGSWHI